MGDSNIQAREFSELENWLGRKIHLLGASPPKQYAVIEAFTQPTLIGDPPADIVGLDWNGAQKVAYYASTGAATDGSQPITCPSEKRSVNH